MGDKILRVFHLQVEEACFMQSIPEGKHLFHRLDLIPDAGVGQKGSQGSIMDLEGLKPGNQSLNLFPFVLLQRP
jgi:hypothetical protein